MGIRERRFSNLRHLLVSAGLTLLSAAGFAQSADVEMTGEVFEMYADDFVNHRAEHFYALHDHASGGLYRLRFRDGERPAFRTGARVRVRGRKQGNEVTLAADGASTQAIEVAPAAVTGEQKTIVIGINFQNANLECSAAQIQGMMFSGNPSVSSLYLETSLGNLWFTGDVVGPFTINYNSSGACDYSAWANAADAAAQAAGVNLSQYTRKVYVFPKINGCNWAGLGTVGGNPSRAWIAACDFADVYAHELGHNIGMHHASTDANNDGASDCEYCDNSDVMGYGGVGLRALNGPHREQMGWYAAGKVQTIAGEGVYLVAPLEKLPADTPYPQILKIAKPGTSEYYYFSYRRALGANANMPAAYADRTSVHRYSGAGTVQTYLIKTLADSGSFTDSTTGLTIAQLSHNNDFATLNISYGCTPAAPGLAPALASQSAAAGAKLSYVLSVVNHDSAACGSSTFFLMPTVPAGWSGAVSPSSMTLAPGQAGTATFSVTSDSKSASGDYPAAVRLTDNFNLMHSATGAVTYTVTGGADADTEPPSSPTNLTATPRKRRINLTWDRSTDNVRVTGYVVRRDGVVIGQTKRTKIVDRGLAEGAVYSYTVAARDAAGNESAPAAVAGVTATR
jgi:hypothetical protein